MLMRLRSLLRAQTIVTMSPIANPLREGEPEPRPQTVLPASAWTVSVPFVTTARRPLTCSLSDWVGGLLDSLAVVVVSPAPFFSTGGAPEPPPPPPVLGGRPEEARTRFDPHVTPVAKMLPIQIEPK